jgi:hypothetical protein
MWSLDLDIRGGHRGANSETGVRLPVFFIKLYSIE